MKKVIVIGGGAAGFFAAINAKEKNPELDIIILEKGKEVLQKVKISGGGRCNVTHACFDPRELSKSYPRGERELLGPFHAFMTGDTFEWFESNGIPLKIESDGRVFPESNSSQTIIDCFLRKTNELNIQILKNQGVIGLSKYNGSWIVQTKSDEFFCDFLVFAAGSSKQAWKIVEQLGHSIVAPVPSLFTFNISDPRISDLSGISVPNASVKLLGSNLETNGPLLITHWGLSGPAILKLSAFGARVLNQMDYQYRISVNWLSLSRGNVFDEFVENKKRLASKKVYSKSPFESLPRRLWEQLIKASKINTEQNRADLTKRQLEELSLQVTNCIFSAQGKSTFKEEFVTAGGIDLKEINFKRFESKIHPNLFLIGEAINIDAVTGGFNFQNAWTGGWLVSEALKKH